MCIHIYIYTYIYVLVINKNVDLWEKNVFYVMNKQGELAKSDANHHPTVEMPSAIGASSAFDDVGIASWDPSRGWIDQCPGHIWGTCGISNFAILQ
jgi:hypothetical protein